MNLNEFYDKAYDWIILKGPGILLGLLVLLVGLWFTKLLSKWLMKHMQKKSVDPSAKTFLISLSITVLRVLIILAAMQIIGLQMTLFAALIGAFGVAAGLALSGTLQNFASGVLILLLKPFKVGDNIFAQNQEGTISSIEIFYTTLTTYDNKTVIIPNSKLSNEVIVNISSSGTRRLDIELKFPNSVNFEAVKEKINHAIDQSQNIQSAPKRRIGVSSIEADSYKVMINVWVNAHGFVDTKMAVQQAILTELGDNKKSSMN